MQRHQPFSGNHPLETPCQPAKGAFCRTKCLVLGTEEQNFNINFCSFIIWLVLQRVQPIRSLWAASVGAAGVAESLKPQAGLQQRVFSNGLGIP